MSINDSLVGQNVAFQIIDAADREMRGELDFLVKEEFYGVKDDSVKIEDFVKALDKDAILDAAVAEFREGLAKVLAKSIEDILEDEE